jgi:hypothetical protein
MVRDCGGSINPRPGSIQLLGGPRLAQPRGLLATLGESAEALIPLAASLFALYKGVKELEKEKRPGLGSRLN